MNRIDDNPKYFSGYYLYLQCLNDSITKSRREGKEPTKLYLGKNLVQEWINLTYIGAPEAFCPQDVMDNLNLKLSVIVTDNYNEFTVQ